MTLPVSTPEYAAFKVITDIGGLAYGPLISRRLGTSLGVNLLGQQKICSFDCPYCELGSTTIRMNQLKADGFFPTVQAIDIALRAKLREVLEKNQTLDYITLSGNGEPTLHPDFLECFQAVLTARADICPTVKVTVLSNGAHCDNKRVVQGLNLLDERMIKLDAGNEHTFKRINQPLIRGNLSKITSGASKLNDLIVQSLFIQGEYDNTSLADIEEWMEVIGIVRPKTVHVYTINRIPAMSGIKAASEDTLYTIASRLKRKLQIDCAVFP